MLEKRGEVLRNMKELEAEADSLINILANEETASNIQNTRWENLKTAELRSP